MRLYSNDFRETQAKIGLARPRLYTLDEISDEVGLTTGELVGVVRKHKIQSPFDRARPLKYRLSDFQAVLNETRATEFVVDKGIPIPKVHKKSERWEPVLAAMGVGDSIVLSDGDCTELLAATRRDNPRVKLTTRKAEAAGTRRIWRVT